MGLSAVASWWVAAVAGAFETSMLYPPSEVAPGAATRANASVLEFHGEPVSRHLLDGGHALEEFTLTLELRSTAGCLPAGPHPSLQTFVAGYEVDDENGGVAPWYLAGCPLVNGMSVEEPPASWNPKRRAKRKCCAIHPSDELAQSSGFPGAEALRERSYEARARGARSDFGLALSSEGDSLVFGVGLRDFESHSSHGRPVRDLSAQTVRLPGLLDGAWHSVAAIRRLKKVRAAAAVRGVQPPKIQGSDPLLLEELAIFVDGRRVRVERMGSTGGANGTLAAELAVATSLRAAKLHGARQPRLQPLHDAPYWAQLGQLYRGCLRGPAIHRRALSPSEVAHLHRSNLERAGGGGACLGEKMGPSSPLPTVLASSMAPAPASAPLQARYPVYYLTHSDPGSLEMAARFRASVQASAAGGGAGRLDLREVVLGEMGESQRERYGPKGDLIERALASHPPGTIVVVTDIDIGFVAPFAALADILDLYMGANPDADAVFQRDDDQTLTANLGFMALRCRPRVSAFFRTVAQMAMQNTRREPVTDLRGRPVALKGGDQRIANRILRNPEVLSDLEPLQWALFPAELATRSVRLQRGLMYRNDRTVVLFHLNDYGRASLAPSRARDIKLAMLRHMLSALEAKKADARVLWAAAARHNAALER